jgi:uncharacterized membrane protein
VTRVCGIAIPRAKLSHEDRVPDSYNARSLASKYCVGLMMTPVAPNFSVVGASVNFWCRKKIFKKVVDLVFV